MNKLHYLPAVFLCINLLFSHTIFAQAGKNDTRLRSLQKNIDRIEDRLSDAEHKMLIGDSLIHHGDQQIARADKDFFRIADEVKKVNKDYRIKRKHLYKQSKSTNREISMAARNDLRQLEESHRLAIRKFSEEAREMKKSAMLGDAEIRRGQQLQASAAKTLKDTQKALQEARERYELAMSWGN